MAKPSEHPLLFSSVLYFPMWISIFDVHVWCNTPAIFFCSNFSNAKMCFSSSLLTVHDSHANNKTEMARERQRGRITFDFVFVLRFQILQITFSLDNAVVALVIRISISLSYFAVTVTVEPRYTNSLTRSRTIPSSSTSTFIVPPILIT